MTTVTNDNIPWAGSQYEQAVECAEGACARRIAEMLLCASRQARRLPTLKVFDSQKQPGHGKFKTHPDR